MHDEAAPTREHIHSVLQVVTTQDVRKSDLEIATGLTRSALNGILRICCQAGLTIAMPSFDRRVDNDDIGVYRITERGEAWTLAGGSWDNPIERALDKIEFLIENRRGAKGTKAAYVDAWETIAGISYKDRASVRSVPAGRNKEAAAV